jgi:hypothetical protein
VVKKESKLIAPGQTQAQVNEINPFKSTVTAAPKQVDKPFISWQKGIFLKIT